MPNGAKADIWAALAAPLPLTAVEWRQDGKPVAKGTHFIARFVPYITAQFCRERLDAVVPGHWNLSLEQVKDAVDDDGKPLNCFMATISIEGTKGNPELHYDAVTRSDVGEGPSPKAAATDAFKRACMRFGMGAELYTWENNWVELESGDKYARPKEDPGAVWIRKQQKAIQKAPEAGAQAEAPRPQKAPPARNHDTHKDPPRMDRVPHAGMSDEEYANQLAQQRDPF
jgi:hypothetical protein